MKETKTKTISKKIVECTAELSLEISSDDVEQMLEEISVEFSKSANVPGFRPGRAPKDLVRKHYKKEVGEEAMKQLIRNAYEASLQEHSLTPITLPEISGIKFEEGSPLTFQFKVCLKPEVRLRNYKGMQLKRERAELKEEDVDKALENLRVMNAKYDAVEGRALQMGDYAICDLECTIDGEPLHKKRENFWIVLDKEASNAALSEQMAGMTKGEERECPVPMPKDHQNKKLAGKVVVYKVKVKEIKARSLPAIDDEFAKDLGKDSLDALRQDVRMELAKSIERKVEAALQRDLLDRLTREIDFVVPPMFVERQLKYLVENAKEEYAQKGIRRQDLDAKTKEFEDQYRAEALKRVKLYFILDEISQAEGIECANDDLEGAYSAMAAESTQTKEQIRAHYEKENLVHDLHEKIREEKTIQFLLKNAKID